MPNLACRSFRALVFSIKESTIRKGTFYYPKRLLWSYCMLGSLWLWAIAHAAPAQMPAANVVVASARSMQMAPNTWLAGSIVSRNDAKIAAETEGRLIWVAEVGTRVEAGEVVAELDDKILTESLKEHLASVDRELAKLRFSAQEVQRLQRLAKQKNTAQNALDEAVANEKVAESELKAARARVQQTKEWLNRTQIKAPYAGVVTQRFSQAGEWAVSGQEIVQIVDTESLEAQSWVPAKILSFLSPGTDVVIKSGKKIGRATIRAIVPVGDHRSRLYELRLQLDDTPWTAGEAIRVSVPTAETKQVVAVPRDALVLRRDGTTIFRVGEDKLAQQVSVITGAAAGEFIEVIGNVSPGDSIVTHGGERLRPGQPVTILPAAGGTR